MGEDVTTTRTFTREDRQRYREKLRRCLDVFARMLAESKFDFERPLTGLEIEFNLVDGQPGPGDAQRRGSQRHRQRRLPDRARPVQHRDQRPAPRPAGPAPPTDLETELRASLNDAEERSRAVDAHIVMIGILPTLNPATSRPHRSAPTRATR